MIKKRDFPTFVLLNLITCGIYGYWFVYSISKDVNVMCAGDSDETPGLFMYILLSIITCGAYSYCWFYTVSSRLNSNASRYGLTFSENGILVLVLMLSGTLTGGIGSMVAYNILIRNTNAMANAYNAYAAQQAGGYQPPVA